MKLKFLLAKTFKGQTLIEVVLVMGLAAIMIPALLTGLVASRNGKPQQAQRMQGVTVLKETEVAVRNIRNSNWASISSLPVNTPYHTALASSQWSLLPGSYTDSNEITQTVVISNVMRDINGAIVESGGTVDPSTKKVIITISWTKPSVSSISSTQYLTNTKNLSKTHTLSADFNPGTMTSVEVVSSTPGPTPLPGDGEVVLERSAGTADWCNPQDSIVETLNLPKRGNAISTPVAGNAYIATGDDGPGESFVNVGIAYPAPPAPPVASVVATHIGDYQTNAIYSDGTYAYLAINGTTQQVRILNITSQPYVEVGTITVAGINANGVYVSGNTAYVTSGDKVFKVDVTNKNGAHTPIASKAMTLNVFDNAVARQVVVVNNRVFVAVEGAIAGLQIFRTSDLKLFGLAKPAFKQTPRGLYVNSQGTRAYVAFSGGNGLVQKGFFIINVYEPDSVWIPILAYYLHHKVGSYNTGSLDPRGMIIAPGNSNRALIGGLSGNYEYQVINIANESNPVFCGGLNIDAGVTGVAGALDQYSNVFSFLLTGDTTDQFKIIQGGAGGGGGLYAGSGTFESDTIDAGSSSVFNRFVSNISQPANTTMQLQVGVSSVGISGTCSDAQYTFVGPNGDTSAYFTPSGNTILGTVPVGDFGSYYQNPGRCFRYKAYFTNSASATPALYDFTVNYSP